MSQSIRFSQRLKKCHRYLGCCIKGTHTGKKVKTLSQQSLRHAFRAIKIPISVCHMFEFAWSAYDVMYDVMYYNMHYISLFPFPGFFRLKVSRHQVSPLEKTAASVCGSHASLVGLQVSMV